MKQKQTKCQVNNQLIRWRKFLQLTNKLKIPKVIWTKEDGAKARDGELPIITREVVNKEFIGFKLVPSTTKINLPNGINIELTSFDIVGLIQKLLHVA